MNTFIDWFASQGFRNFGAAEFTNYFARERKGMKNSLPPRRIFQIFIAQSHLPTFLCRLTVPFFQSDGIFKTDKRRKIHSHGFHPLRYSWIQRLPYRPKIYHSQPRSEKDKPKKPYDICGSFSLSPLVLSTAAMQQSDKSQRADQQSAWLGHRSERDIRDSHRSRV